MFKRIKLAGVLAAIILSVGVASSMAQPATGGPSAEGSATRQGAPTQGFNPDKVEVHEADLLGKLRSVQGNISIPDGRAATLIQPDGRVWRDYRRGPLLWITAACVLGMIGMLLLFYIIRGRIRIEGGRGTATVLRFGAFERFMHWLTATSWCILALSGLNVVAGRRVLLPLIGNDAFTEMSEWLKFSHNFLAFPFTAGVVLMFLVWVRHNIPNKIDVEWFKKGGGLIGHQHPAAEKFNGGQKAIFWIVVLGGGALALTGFALLFPFYVTDIFGMQIAQVAHGGVALLMIAAMLGHIYIGSVGMEGAIDAMGSGTVDLKWAKEHHSLWVEEELAKVGRPIQHPAE
jgi:formate dehydrogenase subunit gamma